MSVNHGVNKVRFPAPVMAGSRVRAGVERREVTAVGGATRSSPGSPSNAKAADEVSTRSAWRPEDVQAAKPH
ncbi:hypothetical protein [Streptomyces sp. NPDC048623]|uniref:hypothetical protein n=1 Tax=Streptomyces sp. NPDC048623 TaxID=3155761 RepID=UPI003446B304